MAEMLSAFEKAAIEVLGIDFSASPASSHPALETLLDYEAGVLPPHECSLVEAHAVRCTTCRGRLQRLEETAERTQTDFCKRTSAWDFASWHREHCEKAETRWSKRRIWHPAGAVWAVAAAGVAVACIAAGLARILLPSSRLIARGTEWSTMRWDLIALFSGAGIAIAALVVILVRGRRR